jgi:putative ABC transport system permease protein
VLGVSARQILGTILLEASVLGVLATALGLLIGRLLAHGLVTLMLRTIGDLYFTATVMAAAPSPRTYAVGVVLGLGATLVAALKPSLDAARSTPAAAMRRAELERRARRGARRAGLWALPVLAAATIVLGADSRNLYVAFAGLFLVLAAGALLTPVTTVALMRISEKPARALFKLPGLLAVRGVAASLSRTGVATSALAVAVATVVGIGLMIGSFRSSFTAWLHTTLTSDLYVAFDSSGRAIDDDTLRSLTAIPGVADISLTRNALVPTAEGDVAVRAVRPGAAGWGLDLTAGRADQALAELGAGKGVVVSERFAFGRGLRVGDALTLPTKRGVKAFPIVGVFRDYNTGQYTAVMALEAYRRDWEDSKLTGLGLRLEHADAADVEARIRELLGPGLRVRSTAAIERISLEIFDRTFRITEVLRILAALVAFFGVLSVLLSIELERAHELAVLRALGFGPRQLTVTLLTQTGLLGAAAGVAAVPLGTALAGLLVYVINERSFGWTMELKLTAAPIAAGLLLAVAAAVVAGIYPAVRAARVELGGALREE